MSAGNNILLWDFEKNSENLLASQGNLSPNRVKDMIFFICMWDYL